MAEISPEFMMFMNLQQLCPLFLPAFRIDLEQMARKFITHLSLRRGRSAPRRPENTSDQREAVYPLEA